MKILIVTHSYPRYVGDWSSNFIEELCISYIKSGCEVSLLIPNVIEWDRSIADMQGVNLIQYNYLPIKAMQIFGYGNALSNDKKLSLKHLTLIPFIILCGTLKFCKFLKKNKDYDFVHCHWAVPNTIIAVLGRKLLRKKIPIFTSFPGSDVTALTNSGKLGSIITNAIIAKSNYLSCNSNDLRDELVRLGLKKEKIDLVIYGVDSNKKKNDINGREEIRKKYEIKKNEILLLMVGRFVEKKGFSTGLKAMKKILEHFPETKLMLVGDGYLREEYNEIIKFEKISQNVIFTGIVPLDQLVMYYSASDVFLMPSIKQPADGLNVVVVEAMACGKPIVATNMGGNELVVFENFNGFLHNEKDFVTLANSVIRLLIDSDLRQKFGENSRLLIESKFNWENISNYYKNQFYKTRNEKLPRTTS